MPLNHCTKTTTKGGHTMGGYWIGFDTTSMWIKSVISLLRGQWECQQKYKVVDNKKFP